MSFDVLITGCTGLVGRHLLYHLMKDNIQGDIYVLLRGESALAVTNKLKKLFTSPSVPDTLLRLPDLNERIKKIRIIQSDLRNPHALKQAIEKDLNPGRRLVVFHAAGSVNLANTESARIEVYEHNYLGTKNLLNALENRDFNFIHLSTAFSVGHVTGMLPNDYFSVNTSLFRNHYEECKRKTETELLEMSVLKGWNISIIRPSIICGRLTDQPLYYTSKFDVFYSWVRFFWKMAKAKDCKRLRILAQPDSKLNIVPVDYVASATIKAWENKIPQLNAVNPVQFDIRTGMRKTLELMKFDKFEFVESIPEDLNRWEEFYYSTIGSVFGQYLESDQYYDCTLLKSLMGTSINTDVNLHLENLIQYAQQCRFKDDQ